MVDLTKRWVRFRGLPDDVLETMPEYVQGAFLAARRDGFEVEMLCAGAKVPKERRAPRRLVIVADDLEEGGDGGPLHFDLAALSTDVHAARRIFVISSSDKPALYAAAYDAAVEDLGEGFGAAVIVETRSRFASAWVRTLTAVREGRAIDEAVSLGGAGEARSRRKGENLC